VHTHRAEFAVSLVLIVAGCSAASAHHDTKATSARYELRGNWWTSEQGSCDSFCQVGTPPNECDDAACKLVTVTWFGDVAVEAAITLSPNHRQFSRFGPLSERAYQATDETIQFDGYGAMHYEVSDVLLIERQRLEYAGEDLDQALDRAYREDEWMAVSF
jgi:hypothetical protein